MVHGGSHRAWLEIAASPVRNNGNAFRRGIEPFSMETAAASLTLANYRRVSRKAAGGSALKGRDISAQGKRSGVSREAPPWVSLLSESKP